VGEEEQDLERRSLDGMVAFLTRLFPDLAEIQAMRYLSLADGDALVAAGIIVSDIGMKRFFDSGLAVMEMALLNCAALAAGHPDPDSLVCAWRNISSRMMDRVLPLLNDLSGNPSSSHHCLDSSIVMLRRLLNEGPRVYCEEPMSWAWQLAADRHRPRSVPYQHTRLLSRTLHDAIHAFYLQALACLPVGELRSRLHRSLLRAGYCYGPFDPVSNIIINTIWYDAAFPPAKTLDLDIIGTESLHRMENRSVYGLASFFCTRYHFFTFQQAVRCLLEADANLVAADINFDSAVSLLGCGPNTSVKDGFLAAAKAACHPNPDAQVKLLTSCKAMLGSAMSLLQGSKKLSSQDVQRLAALLCPEPPSGETTALTLPTLKGYRHAHLADVHTRISKKVNALLNAYEQMPNGVGLVCLLLVIANISSYINGLCSPVVQFQDPKFELHMICGVNDRVSCSSSGPPPRVCYPTHRSHVNFMATPKSPCGDGVPILFFAEISYGYEDTSFCWPLPFPLPCAGML
jgi:hypothetical protein